MNVDTLMGDFHLFDKRKEGNSLLCRIQGFLYYVFGASVFYTLALQAFFRFTRVVYSRKIIFQRCGTQLILVGLGWFFSFLPTVLSVLSSRSIVFLASEHYCSLDADAKPLATLIIFSCNYTLPISFLCILYTRVIIFIRQSTERMALAARQQMKRDVIVLRRIILVVTILVVLGAPGPIFIIMRFINGQLHPLAYRITWLTGLTGILFLSVALCIITPQMKILLMTMTVRRIRVAALTTGYPF
ncbi:unnamed protein product [Rotaria sp. Silwood2]|nr:unnamed protein product [Rotaria sp. Silwood2]CAF2626010.1 unnamed protein product [Rotaria sp. Silwood2]CAF3018990.1 unnamed protein product [Rotaria sp. Silwood2]CAF3865926.1 unnamed protein product [Rotaria sp. Silwood2]CAF4241654.1 unnamed protein product [Rotaria sp. Silwood2]